MQKNKLNNVIVLNELSSNIVEEAIVFLKPNVNIKVNEWINVRKDNSSKEFDREKTILDEAQSIIENHIKEIENKNKRKNIKEFEKKYKMFRKISIILFLINIFCMLKIFN